MQNLGFWILNDIIWAKTNPVPNFKGTRFCNAHETLLWCVKNKNAKFTFNYKTMKHLNGGKQDKSVWNIGLCIGNERLKGENGKKLHSTQKPETLLEKIVLSSTKFGDLVLDPFFGTGTTGAAAKKFGRHFIGIEQNMAYVKAANERISKVKADLNDISLGNLEVKPPKVSLNELRNAGFFKENEPLYDKFGKFIGNLTGDKIDNGREILSIHKMAAKILERKNYNGWSYFYIKNSGKLISIDSLRYKFKEMNL